MHSRRITEKVKEDYNEIAEEFSASRAYPWKDFELFLPHYRENAQQSCVLDLGCGNGRLLGKFLKKHGYGDYLGVDLSENLLEFAKKAYPDEKFVCADMADVAKLEELGLQDGRWDAIFAIASFHHLPPERQLETLKKWKKLLKPGGYLFMTNWNLYQKKYLPLLFRSFVFPTFGRRGVLVPWRNRVNRYYYAFTKRRLTKLLTEAGYKIELNDYVNDGEYGTLLNSKNIVTVARALES
jgi:SAM-dependent methyltransferase